MLLASLSQQQFSKLLVLQKETHVPYVRKQILIKKLQPLEIKTEHIQYIIYIEF